MTAPELPGPPPTPELAQFDVEYPTDGLNRMTTFFRLFWLIPIFVVIGFLAGTSGDASAGDGTYRAAGTAGGIIVIPTALMLIFRSKYPQWWFDFNLQLSRFSARVTSSLTLLTDEYPSTDEEQKVHLSLPQPDGEKLSNILPIFKWLLAIPHYVVLFFLIIGAFFAVIIAWFAILFTGNYPRGLFDYIVGVHRWALRVSAYAFLLVTDDYPPFRLAA